MDTTTTTTEATHTTKTTPERMPLRLQIPKRIAQVRERLTEHTLEEITPPAGKVRSFRMRKPGTRIDSVLLTFTPEGIAIQGDLTPGTNGAVSRGKSLEWFAGEIGYDYLAGKFLEKEWVPEKAADAMREDAQAVELDLAEFDTDTEREQREQAEDDEESALDRETILAYAAKTREEAAKARAPLVEKAKRYREIADELDDGEMQIHEFVEALDELGIQYESEGHAYPPNEVVLLAAIQQRFAELYAQGDWAGAGLCEVETLKAHLTEERALRDVAQTEVRRLRAEVDAALVRAENAEAMVAITPPAPPTTAWRALGPERRAKVLNHLRGDVANGRALAAGYTDQMRAALDAGWPKAARSAGTAAGEALARAEEHEAALQVLEAAGG